MKLCQIIDQLEQFVPMKKTEQYPKTLVTGKLGREIKKVGICLDFLSSTITKARVEGCQLLLVHHGPPNYDSWKSAITARKIKLAKRSNLAVYTLPFCLDVSPLGPPTGFIRLLGIDAEPVTVKFQNRRVSNAAFKLKGSISHHKLLEKLRTYPSSYMRVYGKPQKSYSRVIIVAGGGFKVELIEQTKPEVYISGDLNIRAIRAAEELGIVLIELSHSSMENFPLKLTARHLENYLPVPVVYVEQKEPRVRVVSTKDVWGT